MRPKQVTLSGEVAESIEKFCKKNGIIRQCFLDEAAINHLKAMQEKLSKSDKM